MAGEIIRVDVDGLDEIQFKLSLLGRSLNNYAQAAMREAGKDVLEVEGLQKYPPASEANRPPTPYYERGKGMQYKSRNDGRSERYGTQWHVDDVSYGVRLSNRASYAIFLAGDEQPKFHGERGWRKLKDVVDERMDKIKKTVVAWVKKAIQDAGLDVLGW